MSDSLSFRPIHLNPKECPQEFSGDNQANFRFVRHYINNSSETIHVLHRNNLTIPVRKTLDSNYPNGDFIIRSSWYFYGHNIISDVRKSIEATFGNHSLNSVELKIFEKRLTDAVRSNPHAPRFTLILDRVITARRIKESSFLYLHDEDLVLTTGDESNKALHPYSSEGIVDPSHYDFVSKNGFNGFFLELVDNEKNTSTRFIYTGKRLMEVEPINDPNRRSGIYYYHATNHRISGVELEKKYCTLEEAEETVGLYKTRDEALSGGDPEMLLKKELEAARKDLSISAIDLEKSKQDTAKIKEEYDKLKAERSDFYEERSHFRKDKYEDRSHVRRDSSDILKISAAAIGAGIAVFGLMKGKG